MSFIFVRHAQSQGNATGDYSTDTHDSLSELGIRQAESLARRLTPMRFTRVIVSPLTRAMQTIRPYLLATGQQAEIWPELAEGCWQEPIYTEVTEFPVEPFELTPDLAPCFRFRDGKSVRPCGHESYAHGVYRGRLVLDRLVRDHAQDEVLVVTHGHLLREMLNLVVKSRESVFFDHENCGMTRLIRQGNGWLIDYTNRSTWNGATGI